MGRKRGLASLSTHPGTGKENPCPQRVWERPRALPGDTWFWSRAAAAGTLMHFGARPRRPACARMAAVPLTRIGLSAMSALICGSLAFDTIMVFPDQFKNHILPDKVHILNVSFLVPRMRREFGGCAGNIAYNLHLLGGAPIPMGTVGSDFGPYREHFDALGIDLSRVRVIEELFTPQAFITTDHDNNQITAFHPGAMMRSYENHVKDVPGVTLGLVGPDGREGMIQNAIEFKEMGVPFIFDPGQAMPLFNGPELRTFIEQADYVVVNDYESNLLQERTGWNEKEIVGRVKAYITTRGPKGAVIHTPDKSYDIPPAHERRVVDPTGCGDAFRAGLIFGIQKGYDWLTIGRMGNLMGALKVEHPGTQNQRFTFDEFNEQFKQQFGYALSA